MGKSFTVQRAYRSDESWLVEIVDPDWTVDDVYDALQDGSAEIVPEQEWVLSGRTIIAHVGLLDEFRDDEMYELITVDEDDDEEQQPEAESTDATLCVIRSDWQCFGMDAAMQDSGDCNRNECGEKGANNVH